jgi:uncharacterized protein (TIGR02598 family)
MKIKKQSARGFSLVECVIAVGIVCFSILPMLGLLPAGLNSTRSASVQTGAMNLITSIAADLRTATVGASPRFSINKSASDVDQQTLYFDESGAITSLQANMRYRADIKMIKISDTKSLGRVTVTWPPQATTKNALGLADVVVSLEHK